MGRRYFYQRVKSTDLLCFPKVVDWHCLENVYLWRNVTFETEVVEVCDYATLNKRGLFVELLSTGSHPTSASVALGLAVTNKYILNQINGSSTF